ncbi:hypothetical protein GCM10022214_13710 [Actinomadura miaoliensis]|uniref:Uncharacterized protein n=1 Tax=Actinomadura miaoliensis TaxID=430685 RepID=A0ABP7V8K6_9ACTN
MATPGGKHNASMKYTVKRDGNNLRRRSTGPTFACPIDHQAGAAAQRRFRRSPPNTIKHWGNRYLVVRRPVVIVSSSHDPSLPNSPAAPRRQPHCAPRPRGSL